MNRMMRMLSVVACAAALTASCSKASDPVTTTSAMRVTAIDLGRSLAADKSVADKALEFRPSDTIYLSVQTDGASAKTTLQTRWTYQDGQVVKELSETIAPTGAAHTEFHIQKADGWPAGKYSVTVSLDGAAAGGKDFVVK